MDDEKKAWFTSIFSFNNCWYFFKRWLQYKRCLDFILHMYSNSKKVEFFKVSVLVLSNPFNEKIRLLHCVLELFLSRLYNMETEKNCFKRRHHASVIYFILEWNKSKQGPRLKFESLGRKSKWKLFSYMSCQD